MFYILTRSPPALDHQYFAAHEQLKRAVALPFATRIRRPSTHTTSTISFLMSRATHFAHLSCLGTPPSQPAFSLEALRLLQWRRGLEERRPQTEIEVQAAGRCRRGPRAEDLLGCGAKNMRESEGDEEKEESGSAVG